MFKLALKLACRVIFTEYYTLTVKMRFNRNCPFYKENTYKILRYNLDILLYLEFTYHMESSWVAVLTDNIV